MSQNKRLTADKVFNLAVKYSNEVKKKYKEINTLELARILTAVIKTESNFNPYAKNKNSTARGLSQILICTQRELEYNHLKIELAPAMFNCKSIAQAPVSEGMDKLFNPDYAIRLAAWYLAYQWNRYKDWNKAIAAYNQGSYTDKNKEQGNNYARIVKKNLKDLNLQIFKININNYLFRRKEFY